MPGVGNGIFSHALYVASARSNSGRYHVSCCKWNEFVHVRKQHKRHCDSVVCRSVEHSITK